MEDGGNCRTRKGVLLQLTGRTFSSDCIPPSFPGALLIFKLQAEVASSDLVEGSKQRKDNGMGI